MITVVSFDVWSTLLNSNIDYPRLRAQRFRTFFDLSLPDREIEHTISQVMRAIDKLVDGSGRQMDFADRVACLADIFGRPLPPLADQNRLRKDLAQIHLDHLPPLTEGELCQVFMRLRQMGYRIAVISNTGMTSGQTIRNVLDRHGLLELIGHHIYSDEKQVAKPDYRIFRELMLEADAKPAEILHVGDNPIADVRGAKAVGFRTLHYTPLGETSSGTIRRLRELPDLL